MTKHARCYCLLLMLAGVMVTGACSTGANRRADVWPSVTALPQNPPSDLDTKTPSAVLRSGSDGFVYVVGLKKQVAPGTPFVGRYSGDWPVRDLARPALTAGRVVQNYKGGVALVHLSYQVPDSELDGLEVHWTKGAIKDHLGKGLATIKSVAAKGERAVTLSIGRKHGVRAGDFYALLSVPSGKKAPDAPMLQLSRRLTGVCMVQKAQDDSARCLLWPGSKSEPRVSKPAKGQQALFLEHTFGAAPRAGVIEVATIKGAEKSDARTKVVDALKNYVGSVTDPKVSVEPIDATLDATADEFYRRADKLPHLKKPQLVVGLATAKVDGDTHLIATYTGIGAASGPGMVAAPPDHGIDLGELDSLNKDRLLTFAATVWSGMLVYRGQTSEALIQLHQLLEDPRLTGRLRWHVRDQYAMRWGALDHHREALWLVLQDETLGAKRNDREAWLNALGTHVRLYDFLDLPAQAVAAARRYLDARVKDKPGPNWRSALSMYGEMLMTDGRVDDAMKTVQQLEQVCPKGCNGDLEDYVAGIFWNVPTERHDVQKKLMNFLVDHANEDDPSDMAATRLYQGLMSMRAEDYTQGLIAFLEANRLYKKGNNLNGQARATYFAFLAELSRGEPQQAYEKARDAQRLEMELNDFKSTADIFERMSVLYTNPDFLEKPGPYLGAARQVLGGAVESSIAMGDFRGASEDLLSLGGFMLKIGQADQAKDILTEAVGYAISFQRFDVAALAHLYLGIIAHQQGDRASFRDEISKAKLMAKLSGDPSIQEAVEQMLHPKKNSEVPTQLL